MDDLISRQAAIDALEDAGMTNYQATGDFYGIINALTVIKNLPTAEKKGKWIVHKSPDEYHCGMVECPFCREELIAEPNEYCFCPKCGARMEGEDE